MVVKTVIGLLVGSWLAILLGLGVHKMSAYGRESGIVEKKK